MCLERNPSLSKALFEHPSKRRAFPVCLFPIPPLPPQSGFSQPARQEDGCLFHRVPDVLNCDPAPLSP